MELAAYEKLGAFYLGKKEGEPFLYDSKDLTTHGVVIGMTGSGKTGLSISILEEAAIDGIPAIAIDPKGDLGNLLLTFPALRTEDFAPWVPHGVDPAAEAQRWRDGLASSQEDGARIQRLRDAAEIAIYTPGSRAGRPLSILGSLGAPADRSDPELLAERVSQVATSLLGLVGREVEAGKSREHVLVATILDRAWKAGESIDLAGLVQRIQEPPVTKIGVLDVDAFFPEKERFELAIAYNSLLAAPGFDAWLEGPPLDVAKLLWTKEGKPRIAILSIAHLDDAQRMFFVSLVLGQMVSWMRTQPGTPSLRALLFMDEVVGYFPPVAMPPSKPPLLLLLKQARAFGLGVVLATQNPVDLDYKGLSNAGSWFIGRLQTERDKNRVLDGLEGAAAGGFDRARVDAILSGLPKRHFYVHDVHAEAPAVIETRFTLSYLRGPLTREEIKRLAGTGAGTGTGTGTGAGTGTVKMNEVGSASRPAVPSAVPEVFFPSTLAKPVYRPYVIGAAKVSFIDARTKLDFSREVMFAVAPTDGPLPVRWEDAKWAGQVAVGDLRSEPAANARFLAPDGSLFTEKNFASWQKKFVEWLTGTQGVARWRHEELKKWSHPNEDERSFRARLAQETRESRDAVTAELREKYGSKLATLEERIRKAQGTVAERQDAANAQRWNAGAGIFGAFIGAGSVARGAQRAASSAAKASQKARAAEREQDNLAVLIERHRELTAEAQQAMQEIVTSSDPATAPLEHVMTKPKKTGIAVHLVALAWRADP